MSIVTSRETIRNFINGEWIDSESVETLPVMDPATGKTMTEVPLSTEPEVRVAAAHAHQAFQSWREVPIIERAQIMYRMQALLTQHKDELARSVTRENGKLHAEAMGEVRRGIEVVEFACAAPTLMQGRSLLDVSRGYDTIMHRFPLGVVAGISPFNFPAMIPLWMAPLALVCGNTFVHKPSERTPLTCNMLAELWAEAGLPSGVYNVVHGAKTAVDALLSDPHVRAVSFVGSQPVAAYVYATAAANGKRVQALAGAKNFTIVAPDADMELATATVLSSAFGNAGERCLAGSAVIAVGSAAQALVPRLIASARSMRIGPGDDPAAEMGPVIRSEHCDRILHFIEQGIQEGATLALDGRKGRVEDSQVSEDSEESEDGEGGGYWLRPTIFTGVTPDMVIAREEIFGPVLSVLEAPTLDDAITMANQSRFGNAAVLCTTSGSVARTFQMKIEAGMVGINVGVPAPVAWFPFAGWKQSFYGDLHATGEDAINFYTERKVVTSHW